MPFDPDDRGAWRDAFAAARAATHEALAGLDDAAFRRQVHPEFSPLGWHYGHIVFTEALWLLVEDGGEAMVRPDYAEIFRVDALPKAARTGVPARSDIDDYAAAVRARLLARIDEGAPARNPRLWHFILQHESQHCETMTFVRWLADPAPAAATVAAPAPGRVPVPAGPFVMGGDGDGALDNERRAHVVDLPAFSIDRYPVTQAAYGDFIADGGYRRPELWTEAGWAWRTRAGVTRPLYWTPGGDALPVAGTSRHEADAFCRWQGARLPTEAEWEKAARWDPATGETRTYPWGEGPPTPDLADFDRRTGGPAAVGSHAAGLSAVGCHDMLGGLWEWTSTPFTAYSQFCPFPYAGYSAEYFDGDHFVLKGGSWATRSPVLRASFRNWYMPYVRQILVGFRCVVPGS